jgi:hypothetical protein
MATHNLHQEGVLGSAVQSWVWSLEPGFESQPWVQLGAGVDVSPNLSSRL